jgi:transcriptional regulator GlxA family with amidase domain
MLVVLIVGNSLQTENGLRGMLLGEGFEVVSASNGKGALRAARQRHFDVALVESHLPDMSGLDLIGAFQRDSLGPSFVLMSAVGMARSMVRALKVIATHDRKGPLDHQPFAHNSTTCNGDDQPVGLEGLSLRKGVTDSRVARALAVIDQRYSDERLTVSSIASELRLSTEHMCRLFKQQTGSTFGIALDAQRLKQATLLLRNTALTCKEIAVQVGYGHTGRLDRRFRKRFNITPRALRCVGRSS